MVRKVKLFSSMKIGSGILLMHEQVLNFFYLWTLQGSLNYLILEFFNMKMVLFMYIALPQIALVFCCVHSNLNWSYKIKLIIILAHIEIIKLGARDFFRWRGHSLFLKHHYLLCHCISIFLFPVPQKTDWWKATKGVSMDLQPPSLRKSNKR